MDQTLKKEPKIKSKAYMENCADNGTNNESFLAKNGKNIITFDKYFMGKKIGSTEVIFDIETLYKNSGDQMVCELINTLGLLQEHKFDQVELTTLEERVKSYEKIMDFVSKSYLAEIQGEKK